MKTIVFDKASWGEGPWVGEADQLKWVDQATGLPCFMTRGPVGSWCGYVGVSKTHPYFKASYDDLDISVHGGLTYAGIGNEYIGHEGRGTDELWWFGFDCAHSEDFSPDMEAKMKAWNHTYDFHNTYRTQTYVTEQVTQLAQQLYELRDKTRRYPTCGATIHKESAE